MSKFDLKEQASIYGSYHNTMGNRVIHFVFVPFIIYGLFIFLRLSKFFLPEQVVINFAFDVSRFGFSDQLVIDLAMVVVIAWAIYCSFLDSFVGTLLFGFFLVTLTFADATIAQINNTRHALWFAGFVELVAWGIQVIVGHGYFERRKPALTDNLFQMIVSPFFLVLEFLFMFGYRPSLYAQVEHEIECKIAEWKASQKKGRSSSSSRSSSNTIQHTIEDLKDVARFSSERRSRSKSPSRGKSPSREKSPSRAKSPSRGKSPSRTMKELSGLSESLNGKYWQ